MLFTWLSTVRQLYKHRLQSDPKHTHWRSSVSHRLPIKRSMKWQLKRAIYKMITEVSSRCESLFIRCCPTVRSVRLSGNGRYTRSADSSRFDAMRLNSSRLDSTRLGSQAVATLHTKQGRTEAPLWVYPTFIQSSLCSFCAIFANLFSYINLTRSVGQSSLLWWKLQCQV